MKLYIAHQFDSRHEVRELELELEKELGIEIVNPFYDLTRDDVKAIEDGSMKRYEADPDKIVSRDLEALRHCDALIGIISNTEVSYGTPMEIMFMSVLPKPIFLLVTNGHEKHPWLVSLSHSIHTNKEDFIKQLRTWIYMEETWK
jgi:nucleoside 2-deoxyribosyltransferase